jgi:K+-sensing histidine kinase KdpD
MAPTHPMGDAPMQAVAAPASDAWRFAGLDLIPAQTAVLDRQGVIQYVNAAWNRFARANGYRGDGFVGINYLDVCRSADGAERDDGSAFAAGLHQVLAGGADQFALSYPCHAPDRERWYKALVERHGDAVVVCHVDITAEHTAAARAVDPIWNRATLHELKTPLNSVHGFAELALDEVRAARGTVDIPDCLATIRDSADQMLQVVNDVLRNATSATLGDEDVPLDEILEDIRNRHHGAAARQGIALETRVAGNVVLRADPDRLTKILDNLVSNAVKYSPAGGTVRMTAGTNPSTGTEIAVDDDGIGIPAEHVPAIFKPYARLDEHPAVAKREGSGLGLAVARNLMQMHGGEIRVDSTPGAGSRFTLAFPAWRTLATGDG